MGGRNIQDAAANGSATGWKAFLFPYSFLLNSSPARHILGKLSHLPLLPFLPGGHHAPGSFQGTSNTSQPVIKQSMWSRTTQPARLHEPGTHLGLHTGLIVYAPWLLLLASPTKESSGPSVFPLLLQNCQGLASEPDCFEA